MDLYNVLVTLLISICIIGFIYLKLMLRRISPFLVYNKRNNRIEQSISIEMYIKLSKKNNFKNGDKTRYILEQIIKSKLGVQTFFEDFEGVEIQTVTNQDMIKQLKYFEARGLIAVEQIGEVKLKRQILPKITLMGVKTTILNATNRSYWDYIFEEEEVGMYRIKVTK